MEPTAFDGPKEEDIQHFKIIPAGRAHPVRLCMRELQVGKFLLIPRKEWTRRGKTPKEFVDKENARGLQQFELYQTIDKETWLVKRVA